MSRPGRLSKSSRLCRSWWMNLPHVKMAPQPHPNHGFMFKRKVILQGMSRPIDLHQELVTIKLSTLRFHQVLVPIKVSTPSAVANAWFVKTDAFASWKKIQTTDIADAVTIEGAKLTPQVCRLQRVLFEKGVYIAALGTLSESYGWWKKSCTTQGARNLVFITALRTFRAPELVQDFFHQQ